MPVLSILIGRTRFLHLESHWNVEYYKYNHISDFSTTWLTERHGQLNIDAKIDILYVETVVRISISNNFTKY